MSQSGAPVTQSPEGPKPLVIDTLSVAYGGIQAVQGISLEVGPKEIVALIGANGAGKSSTLQAVMKLVEAQSGSISVFGTDIGRLRTHQIVELGVALVPEGRAIFSQLTVRENLELGGFPHRGEARRLAQNMERVVALFPRLGERIRQEGGTLSGGEQQMLAIGRALMAEPRLLLLDEPSLGLAPILVNQIFESIVEIAASGLTILLIEQNTRLALEVAHRAYCMVTGVISLQGLSSDLALDPRIQAAYLGADAPL